MENWVPIPNTNERYFVSDTGRVKSLCGRTERILKPTRHRVKRKCGDAFYQRVRIVNHRDENPQNNRADNLEWCTHKYNANYGKAQERRLASKRSGGNR